MFYITTAVKKIASLKKRIKIVQGGTSAGKTIGILEILIDKAQRDKVSSLTSIVSESFPHLRRGAMRDFLNILQAQGYYKDSRWNKTDSTYLFETGSPFEFFSADQPEKVHGARRKRLFINEANHLSFEVFEQLEVRTSEEIYIDYNPTTEFWVHEYIINKRDDYEFIILTYRDNEALDPEIVKSIEQRKGRKDWWRVYGEGLLGEIEGKIYKNWEIIDEVPKEARLERRWLDYGYSNDPTAMGDIYKWNDAYILDEILYQKGLSNKQLADVIFNQKEQVPVASDSAEPKSNDELSAYGITVLPARKGKDSVNNGIQIVQQQKIFITKRSVNIIKEYRNYIWEVDKEGKVINVPTPIFNHHMDGIRYGFESLIDFTSTQIRREQENIFMLNEARQAYNSSK